MEYFRWILLLAGVLLLAFIYFSGRSRKNDASYSSRKLPDEQDPLFSHPQDVEIGDFDDLMPADGRAARARHGAKSAEVEDMPRTPARQQAQEEDFAELEVMSAKELRDNDSDDIMDDLKDVLLEEMQPLDEELQQQLSKQADHPKLIESIAEKIESFSAILSPRRKERLQASAERIKDEPEEHARSTADKIVSLHVMAPEGDLINGAYLQAVFQQRGYEFGEMNIFHSRYKDKTIFSIASMVEPGTFDADMENFHTPGISLFLQLPGPMAADVLFEVLVSEATDIAEALGVRVLDSDRCTLSKQTIQHMREDIYDYMHRQKYFNK